MQPVTVLLTALQLLSLVLPGEPQGLEEKLDSSNVNCSHIQPVHELVRSVSSSVDEGGTCHCVVHLSDNPIPLQQLEQLHSTAQELICKYEQKLSRVTNASLTLKLLADSDQSSFGALQKEVDVL
ncbi:uncharacterized protein LOC108288368 isoform X4 [Cebus imitator]|uniref:uncharacterized protein LOC108288368 isoform X4 n=1 Tax=Cebus imitator TaxID=2715852 RepID=UPI00080A5CE2|nr:uncharacterized protein LOC108288368 isoform X4 [Cebus imitator]